MPRIRSIHYDALKSQKLAAASAEAERLYWRMATHCDDEGRAEDDPRLFAAYLFPLNDDITGPTVDGWLAELDHLGLIVRYEVDGRRFLEVTRWKDYQKPNRAVESKYPSFTEPSVSPHGVVTEGSVSGNGALSAGEGEGEGGSARKRAAPPTDSFVITEALTAWAQEHCPWVDLERERLAWIDWATANHRTYKDLPAGFRTWLRRVKPPLGTTVKPSAYGTPTRALLGRGVDAAPLYELDEAGFAVPKGTL